jgi:D-aspartate ligase
MPLSNPSRAQPDWPPVVVASVYQTGLNLMRDLLRHGVRTVGIDCDPTHEGFRSRYGTSRLCANPDTDPDAWVDFMIALAREIGHRPVLIPAADIFVSALGRHAARLRDHYIFSEASIATQAALATKEQQYALAAGHGLPIPRTEYVQSRQQVEQFVATARFPCLIKPRHQREWDALPPGNPLRGLKLITADDAPTLLAHYAHAEPYRPEAILQEIIAGGDDTKYCYLSVYGAGSRRLGHVVVHELRAHPLGFGSGSIVHPVVDEEIASLCNNFLTSIGYVGICEIEVKRDSRDSAVRLIEANPRYSVTADSAHYAGVEIGWLHYLDLIGQPVVPVTAKLFDFHHVVIHRDIRAVPRYIESGILNWRQVLLTYKGSTRYFDLDPRDPRLAAETLLGSAKVAAGALLRYLNLRK